MPMNISDLNNLQQWQINLFFGIAAVEIVLNISTYFITIFCFYIISKNPLFHTNLIRLIKCVFIYFTFGRIIRFIWIITDAPVNSILGNVRMLSIVMIFSTCGTIVLERICATIWLKIYEKNVSNLLFGFCVFCQIPVSFGFASLMYFEIISTFICGILTTFSVCFGFSALIFIEWFNKKRYKASLTNTTDYTLSERFQLQENIRTALLLRKIITILSGGFLFVGACSIASLLFKDNLIEKCVIIMLNYLFCFCSYTFPLFGVSSNSLTFHTLFKLKRIFYPRFQISSTPLPSTAEQRHASLSTQLRGFDGSQIIFTIDEEREVYFKRLSSSWN